MNTIIQDIRSYLNKQPQPRRVQIYILTSLIFLLLVGTIYILIDSRNNLRNISHLKTLEANNKRLINNNEKLLETVNSLTKTISEENFKDSMRDVLIQENNSLLPIIHSQIETLNKKYENINRISRFTPAELEQYISNEARRIRSGQDMR